MIIKIKSNRDSGEWTVFDRCSKVTYDTTWITLDVGEDAPGYIEQIAQYTMWGDEAGVDYHFMHDMELSIPPAQKPEDRQITGRWIKWIDREDGTGNVIFTNHNGFLMSDDGETIERLL